MNELEAAQDFANQFSLNRVKTEGLYYDRDYKRDAQTGQLELVKEKAVITTHGKVTKVTIGEDAQYRTFEEAVEATKQHWSAYFKKRRQMAKSPKQIVGERRRQKTYRERKKQEKQAIERRQ